MVKRKSLAVEFPEVAKEWDYEKNNGLTPEAVSSGSNKKIWWKCEKGHTWQATIYSRTGLGCRCPYCAGKQPVKGENDFLTLFPELASEWDYDRNIGLHPGDYLIHSNRAFWWKCKEGHSWKTTIHVRSSGHGCPYCTGFKAIQGVNDLVTLRPDLALQWDYEKNGSLRPENVKCLSNKKVWWKCELGHSWKTTVAHRIRNNCPFCGGKKVLQGFNDICTTHPHLLQEWNFEKNDIKPEMLTHGSNKKIWWKCQLGHSWKAAVCDRVRGSNCPYCAGVKAWQGYNDLLTKYPQIAQQWDYEKNLNLTPLEVSANSNKKVWWRCDKGHSWKVAVYGRIQGNGCPYCGNRIVLEMYNDFKTKHPEIVKEWDYERNYPIKPENMAQSAKMKVWWICSQGHSYSATISNRHCGKGCPYCAGKYPIVGETDLLTKYPELKKEWAYERNSNKKPEDYTVYSNISVWWKCENGHYWKATIRSRSSGCGCPTCSGKIRIKTRFV